MQLLRKQVPVYAVADGLLSRPAGWTDAVIIQHDDPFEQGKKIWTFHSGMSSANGTDTLIVEVFPIGAKHVPVKAGQLLGYQGSWSGNPQWPMWIHVYFGLVRATGNFPESFTSFTIQNPSEHLGLQRKPQTEATNMQPLTCANRQ